MGTIAFYAPLKSPEHPVPSGEREMARNLMGLLDGGWPAHDVQLVSDLRSHVKDGNAAAQDALFSQAEAEVARLSQTLTDVRLWVTYHNYYKAPDLIGPQVCAALNIPYVLIESSRARRRLTGPWARFAAAAEAASDAAQVIFYVTALDLITLQRDKTPDQSLVHLRPFLPMPALPQATSAPAQNILSVGMFRGRDKLNSYQIIAETLRALDNSDWHLSIAGDGPARAEVEALMAPFGPRVTLLGQLDRAALTAAYQNASIFLWPGYNEAYGMVYLEAQAAGLPVIAQDRDGVRDVLYPGLYPGLYPAPEDGPKALARALHSLLSDPALARQTGLAARAHVGQHHLAPAALTTLKTALSPLIGAQT